MTRAARNWVNHSPRLLSRLKRLVVPPGRQPRMIRLGPLRGLRMHLDLHHDLQIMLGLYETEIWHWVRRLSRGAISLVDIGAAGGLYTLYFVARTKAQRVYAVEPSYENRSTLHLNLALNSLNEDPRLVVLPVRAGSGLHGSVTLDAILKDAPQPCLVKVDVDGGEAEVLAGATSLLRQPSVSWVVEVHSAELASECERVLEQAGLSVRTVLNAWWRVVLPEMRPIAVNHWLVAVAPGSGSVRATEGD